MELTHFHEYIKKGDRTCSVTFIDQDDKRFTKTLNVPYTLEGNIDYGYWNEIIEGQKRGLISKYKLGIFQFEDNVEIEKYIPPS